MAQFDFGNLESPLSGTVFINGNLEPWRDALHSSHKGGTRPSYAVEGMLWVNDTTNPWVLNMFDGANDIALGSFDTTTNTFTPSGVSQAAEDISFDNTDSGLTATNVQDAIDEAVGDFSDFEGRVVGFATAAQGAKADSALQPTGNGSGLTNLPISIASSVQNATGTSVQFTGLPVRNMHIFSFTLLSSNGSSTILLQGGTTSGYETTGYDGASAQVGPSTGIITASGNAGFLINTNVTSTESYNGRASLSLIDPATNTWECSVQISRAGAGVLSFTTTVKTFSGTLDRLRLVAANGTDSFDGGKARVISY